MTKQQAGDAVSKAVLGVIGDKAIGALLMIVIGISAWVLKTTYDHSTTLSGLDVKISSLIDTVKEHNVAVDLRLGRIVDAEAERREEIAAIKQAMADQEGMMLPRLGTHH